MSSTRAPWFGPLSLVAVTIGLSMSAIPWMLASIGMWWWAVIPPLSGAALLLMRGAPRQIGVGLVISALGAPLFVICLLFGVAVGGDW